ncbi:hypothetical protein PR048_029402 [Dryococelus australis]|uniref:Uncharacterized protein n=1 Tax=Dryococelus australis TaxID=614101 RepID=A0ABQ9GDC5_9NEOP|nr:hypothetical protein PR048_029402 [Dryococelus australis]
MKTQGQCGPVATRRSVAQTSLRLATTMARRENTRACAASAGEWELQRWVKAVARHDTSVESRPPYLKAVHGLHWHAFHLRLRLYAQGHEQACIVFVVYLWDFKRRSYQFIGVQFAAQLRTGSWSGITVCFKMQQVPSHYIVTHFKLVRLSGPWTKDVVDRFVFSTSPQLDLTVTSTTVKVTWSTWLDYSPPSKTNRVLHPWPDHSGFSQGGIVPDDAVPLPSGIAPCSPYLALIGSEDLAVKSHPALFTRSPRIAITSLGRTTRAPNNHDLCPRLSSRDLDGASYSYRPRARREKVHLHRGAPAASSRSCAKHEAEEYPETREDVSNREWTMHNSELLERPMSTRMIQLITHSHREHHPKIASTVRVQTPDSYAQSLAHRPPIAETVFDTRRVRSQVIRAWASPQSLQSVSIKYYYIFKINTPLNVQP